MACLFRRLLPVVSLVVLSLPWVPRPVRAEVEPSSYRLTDKRQPGDRQKVTVVLQLSGQLEMRAASPAGSSEPVSLSAQSKLVYHECLHKIQPAERASGRYYTAAQASVQIAHSKHEVVLGNEQKWIFAATPEASNAARLAAAKRPLSRDELEMLTVPGNSLDVYELLPHRALQAGETWQPSSEGLALLLNLDEVTVNQTRARLVNVARGLARMQLGGTVLGNVDGVATEIALEGDLRFDLQWQRVSWLQLVVDEQREASPIQAGFTIKAEVRMLCEPLAESPLTSETTGKMASLVERRESQLRYLAAGGACQMVHSPAWHVFEEQAAQASLRLVVDGQMIAQCNLQRLANQPAAEPLSMDAFKANIRTALQDGFQEFEAFSEHERQDGYRVMRVAVSGTAADVPIRWLYYYISNPEGAAASCVFTMEAAAVTAFGDHDRLMVQSLQLEPLEEARPASPADAVPAATARTNAPVNSRVNR